MKIRLPRRMKAFIAKWGGLVLAAILVLPMAAIGWAYLYANIRIEATTNFVTQAITITGFEPAELTSETTSGTVYRLYLSIINETPNAAQITITNASKLLLNDISFDIAGSADWQGHVAGESNLHFEGYIVLDADDTQKLDGQPLTLKIAGTITAKAQYAFWSKEETRSFNISASGGWTKEEPALSIT
ncbi:MAG: hypothetical protein FWH51_06675 [Dehalococcoidia bacterium]|nr:hypothetical protein [Dehalococcoidia bacterium]